MGLLGQPGDQDLVCHLILVQSSFGIYESSSQNAQEGHKFRAAFAVHHSILIKMKFRLFVCLSVRYHFCARGFTAGILIWYWHVH